MVDPRASVESLCVVRNESGLNACLSLPVDGKPHLFSFPCRVGDPDGEFDDYGGVISVRCWGLRKIGPRTWQVIPSIRTDVVHAYLVLCDVPEPAPFEKK